jgi:hypothetical protein
VAACHCGSKRIEHGVHYVFNVVFTEIRVLALYEFGLDHLFCLWLGETKSRSGRGAMGAGLGRFCWGAISVFAALPLGEKSRADSNCLV